MRMAEMPTNQSKRKGMIERDYYWSFKKVVLVDKCEQEQRLEYGVRSSNSSIKSMATPRAAVAEVLDEKVTPTSGTVLP